jgi:hypothetical protein
MVFLRHAVVGRKGAGRPPFRRSNRLRALLILGSQKSKIDS